MIKRYLKIYPSIYFTKHVYTAPEIDGSKDLLKKDYVFNQYVNKKEIFLNNKLKKGNCENEIKRIYYFKLWNAMVEHNFTLFENIIHQYLNEGYKYDEVIYSIMTHAYILNHKKKNENAYLVIEEMKRAFMHPIIIKINERMINCFLELELIFCEPSKSLWINVCRFIWETSIKLNRERRRKLKDKLNLLEPNQVLKLTKEDVKKLVKKEYEETLLSMMDTLYLDGEDPYDHILIDKKENYIKIENQKDRNFFPSNDNELTCLNNNHIYNDNINYLKGNIENDTSENVNSFMFSILNEGKNKTIEQEINYRDDYNLNNNDYMTKITNTNNDNNIMMNMENEDMYETDEKDEYYESFDDAEDFDIQLLKKYYNLK
ncbi:hypothetical protein PRSY57_0823800 [Plasmodium reichenowi]|uniref:Uncharacterized protein n=1 Tax=Plasmodium reichenowi TaxID=5854 RepID=A0A151LK09_PLARE|nr:hypothetical protein PRSY57_0823800 [Plasmodium reichenowi]KYN99335.1 hypothetical protein PRSY57_0823800 [Plasmodium reichenowi]